MRNAILVLVAVLAAAPPGRSGTVTISEVKYDAVGSDDGGVFVELFGPPGLSLAGYWLVGVNGAGGAETHRVDLTGAVITGNGFAVIADALSSGSTYVSDADYTFTDFDLQNGPDSVRLYFGSVVVDALGYGTFDPGLVFAGEGTAAPDVSAGMSLARIFADVDTDQNSLDFAPLSSPTPGTGPLSGATTPVPEPGAWLLFGIGLVALAVYSRKQKRPPSSVPTRTSPSWTRGAARERAPTA